MDPVRVALSLAGIVAIIIAAYYATWFISVKASGQGRFKYRNKNINLIDRFAISKDKSFCLVEIAGKVYVIGVTNQSMTLLDTLDAAAFSETGEQRQEAPAWRGIPGGRFTSSLTKRLAAFMAHRMGQRPGAGGGYSSTTFEDSMNDARERSQSSQPEAAPPAERTKDPEEEE